MSDQTIYLMSRTDRVEDASTLARTKEHLISKAISWYWGNQSQCCNHRLTIDVNFELEVVEVHDSVTDEITTYYLFAFDRRTP